MYPKADICAEDETVPDDTEPLPNPNAVIWAEEETSPEGLFIMSP